MSLKALQNKNLIKAKKITFDSIMDQLVPQVSSQKTSNMFDSLIKIFEEKNINQNIGFEKTVEECEDPECRTS